MNGECRDHRLGTLTEREAEVLRRIVAGQGTRPMASEMGVTINTLRGYVQSVLTKLGVHSRLEAAAIAREGQHRVVVVDGDLPGTTADRLCAQVSRSPGLPRVVTLSASSEPERIVNAIRAGAAAWVRKDQSLEHLLQVIRGVARGEIWLSGNEKGNVVRLLLQEQERRQQNVRLLASLTPREREVLMCLAEGPGCREAIANQLYLSVNTVRTHLQNIMAKLGVHSALEAVALAIAAEPALGEHCSRVDGHGTRPRAGRGGS